MVDITKQKLVEEERHAPKSVSAPWSSAFPPSSISRRFRRNIPGQSPVDDASRPLLYVSPQVAVDPGGHAQEWLVNPSARSDRFVADDLERVQQERKRVEATGEPFSTEYRMLARDGQDRLVP